MSAELPAVPDPDVYVSFSAGIDNESVSTLISVMGQLANQGMKNASRHIIGFEKLNVDLAPGIERTDGQSPERSNSRSLRSLAPY